MLFRACCPNPGCGRYLEVEGARLGVKSICPACRQPFLPSAPFDERLLRELPGVASVDREGQHVVVTGTGELVNAVILTLAAAGVTAHDVQLDSSNLEDAFVKLTGRRLNSKGATA